MVILLYACFSSSGYPACFDDLRNLIISTQQISVMFGSKIFELSRTCILKLQFLKCVLLSCKISANILRQSRCKCWPQFNGGLFLALQTIIRSIGGHWALIFELTYFLWYVLSNLPPKVFLRTPLHSTSSLRYHHLLELKFLERCAGTLPFPSTHTYMQSWQRFLHRCSFLTVKF